MKRSKRWMAVIIVLVLCCLLCSCDRLDEMQAQHAVWQQDGSILWNDTVYKKLPVIYADINTTRFDDAVCVTQPDVPVLLSEEYGDYFYRNKEGTYIYGRVDRENQLFCCEDRYDEVAASLSDGFVSKGYCYDYYDGETGEMATCYLTVEQEYAIHHVTDTVMPWGYTDFSTDYLVDLFAYNEGDLHRQDVCQIAYSSGAYYVLYYDLAYMVPYDYELTFETILKVGYQAENKWRDEWW